MGCCTMVKKLITRTLNEKPTYSYYSFEVHCCHVSMSSAVTTSICCFTLKIDENRIRNRVKPSYNGTVWG